MGESIIEKMSSLRNNAITCKICEELVKTRTQVVFGTGNPESKLVFVGEAPGEEEDKNGEPFVGRAGKLLDKILYENSMSRNDIWITNIVKCRPTLLSKDGSLDNRPPNVKEINACKKWLDEELSIIDPKVIVCIGGPSASVIIHKGFKITEERGKWFTDSLYAPYVIAVYHPAYVLRLKNDPFKVARELLSKDIAEAKKKFLEEKDQSKMSLF
ncbi:MAG: uracil-DNA glycosylase [bacterium]